VYLHPSVFGAESFALNESSQDSPRDIDFYPEMLTDEGIATG
jgi:hypothetical protein